MKSFSRKGLAPLLVILAFPAICVAQIEAEERRYIDFFPLKPGMEWLYRIETPRPVRVMRFREQWWLLNSPQLLDLAGGLETISLTKRKESLLRKDILLRFKMKGFVTAEDLPAPVFLYVCKQGADTIAELQIIRDDLQLLGGGGTSFFWIKCSLAHEGSPLPVVYEAARYRMESFPAHRFPAGSKPLTDGFTARPLFVVADLGATFLTGTKPGGDSQDSLTFLGPVNEDGRSRFDLAFRRTVTTQGKTEFTEDTVFSWRRGLTALRQTIGGKTSMEWRLVRISGQ